jgi:hypothetical protein
MHLKVKVLISRWLASRIETRTRRLRRALRDPQRAELHRIRAADRRVRGLAALRGMVLQRHGADELQNGGVIADKSVFGEQAKRKAA